MRTRLARGASRVASTTRQAPPTSRFADPELRPLHQRVDRAITLIHEYYRTTALTRARAARMMGSMAYVYVYRSGDLFTFDERMVL